MDSRILNKLEEINYINIIKESTTEYTIIECCDKYNGEALIYIYFEEERLYVTNNLLELLGYDIDVLSVVNRYNLNLNDY